MNLFKFVFIFAFGSLSLAHAGDETLNVKVKGSGGIVSVFEDDGVKCFVFDGLHVGGISCQGEREEDLDQIKTKKFKISYGGKYKASGIVVRKVIDDKLCYLFNGSDAGGIDCLE